MKPVTGDECLGEHRVRNDHHRGRQVERYLLDSLSFGKVNLFQNTDHIFGFCSPDHSYQRTPATFASLVGQKRIDLTAAQTSLIDTQALSQVLIKQQPVSRMRQLLPPAIIAEMLLVLGGKLLTVYAIMRADTCNALRSRLNSILLKKKRTQGIVCCPQPSSHRKNN